MKPAQPVRKLQVSAKASATRVSVGMVSASSPYLPCHGFIIVCHALIELTEILRQKGTVFHLYFYLFRAMDKVRGFATRLSMVSLIECGNFPTVRGFAAAYSRLFRMDAQKLAKILALAESDHQGEALSALRAARVILARDGMNLRDLALAAGGPARPASPPVTETPTPPVKPSDEAVIVGLRRQVQDLERENASLGRKLNRMRTANEHHREEVEHWRTLAQRTAEQLWDLGKALERRHSRHDRATLRRSIIEQLQDPASGILSDREIARRLGTSPRLVGQCRRRLALVGRRLRLLPVEPRGRGLWSRPDIALLDKPRRRWDGFLAVLTIAARPGYGTKR